MLNSNGQAAHRCATAGVAADPDDFLSQDFVGDQVGGAPANAGICAFESNRLGIVIASIDAVIISAGGPWGAQSVNIEVHEYECRLKTNSWGSRIRQNSVIPAIHRSQATSATT